MLTKTQQKRLIGMVKTVLIHRRNGNVQYEQAAYERLMAACDNLGVDVRDVLEQGVEWLRHNSTAASMNGLV